MSEPRKPTEMNPFKGVWRCSCCLEIVDPMIDRSARWNGAVIEHRCAGHDPQSGYEPCQLFNKPPSTPCPSCAELRSEVARLQRVVENINQRYAEAAEVIHNIGADRLNCRALMADAVRDFHGKGSLFSAAFLAEAAKAVLEQKD